MRKVAAGEEGERGLVFIVLLCDFDVAKFTSLVYAYCNEGICYDREKYLVKNKRF